MRELTTRVAWLIAGGTATGLLLTVIAQRQLRAVVFGVAPLDPETLAAAVSGLAIAAGIAAFLAGVARGEDRSGGCDARRLARSSERSSAAH